MASNYTENYQLPLWAADDAFLRTEFNDAHEKIDGALTEITAGVPKIVAGSYVGTGGAREISLGFQPSAVLLFSCQGSTYSSADTYGGLIAPGMPLKCNAQTEPAAEITETGFKVYGAQSNCCLTNAKNVTFYYIAFRW